MSNPNPLIPQGSLLEQQAKSKPHLRIALCIVAVHCVFLGGLLMQGCKPDETGGSLARTSTNDLPPLDSTNLYPAPTTPSPLTEPSPAFATPGGPTSASPAYTFGTPSNPAPAPTTPMLPPEVTPSAAAAQEHVVAKGDSFYSIGRKFGVTASAIAKANPGVDSTRLRIGQKLQIPAASPGTTSAAAASTAGGAAPLPPTDVYVVKAGDTLLKISRAHGVSVSTIRGLNGLKTDRINVGQKLKLPGRTPAAEPVVPGFPPTTSGTPASPFGMPPAGTATPAPASGSPPR